MIIFAVLFETLVTRMTNWRQSTQLHSFISAYNQYWLDPRHNYTVLNDIWSSHLGVGLAVEQQTTDVQLFSCTLDPPIPQLITEAAWTLPSTFQLHDPLRDWTAVSRTYWYCCSFEGKNIGWKTGFHHWLHLYGKALQRDSANICAWCSPHWRELQ